MTTQYQVKQKGYSEDDNSQVNKADLYNDLIKGYIIVKSSA